MRVGAGREAGRQLMHPLINYGRFLTNWRQSLPRRTFKAAFSAKAPGVYKDIHAVMSAQTDLVEVLGHFDPKLVKMCPASDRAED